MANERKTDRRISPSDGIMLITIALIGADKIERIVRAHADNHDSHHERGDAQGLAHDFQRAQRADESKHRRRNAKQGELPVHKIKKGDQHRYQADNESHLEKCPTGAPLPSRVAEKSWVKQPRTGMRQLIMRL